MSKKVSKPETNNETVEKTSIVVSNSGKGELRKNDNDDNDADMVGNIEIDMPGAYWLEGYMKKDTAGVFMELKTSLKKEQPDKKLLQDKGVLFTNHRKQNRKGKPDYQGNIEVTTPGIFSIEGRIAESKGTKYMELSVIEGSSDNTIDESDMPF